MAAVFSAAFSVSARPLAPVESVTEGVDPAVAAVYFKEAAQLSDADDGKTWGVRLYGPMLLVDARTHSAVANSPDAEGRLSKVGDVYAGVLPRDVNVANTATAWAGVHWTMIGWPLPQDRRDRLSLMTHELFHRVQDQIGLSSRNVANDHLDTADGRIWMRLEWLALKRALEERGAARAAAVSDAMSFRKYRQSLFPQARREETALECGEGLAEYTGFKLSSRSQGEFVSRAIQAIKQALHAQSFTRSFAYTSGPAYGALLDDAGIVWRRNFKSGSDFGEVIEQAFRLKTPPDLKLLATQRAVDYDGDEVIAQEKRRESIHREAVKKFRATLVDGPVLEIPPMSKFNYSFDPNNVMSLGELGTVYPIVRVTDEWGVLEASDGALMIRDGSGIRKVQVSAPPAPDARPLQGPGWKLNLNDGWTVVAAARKGDFTVKRTDSEK